MQKTNLLKIISRDSKNPDKLWDQLLQICPKLVHWGGDILKKGLSDYVKTIVYEPFYICKDHRNLFSSFYSKKFVTISPYCERLHFFNDSISDLHHLKCYPEEYCESYMGYSVIRPIYNRCLGRTVIDPYKIGKKLERGYFLLRTKFYPHISGNIFPVYGFPYISQDTEATVCAHSSLWGICRYLSQRYSAYKEIYPFDLVNMTDTTLGRTSPYRGMTYLDYSKILTEFGTYPLIIRLRTMDTDTNPDKFKELFTYIESGFPIIASFGGHAVTIIGHTYDPNKPVKAEDGFIDNSSFLKHFIVIDDNIFPYQKLGFKDDAENYGQFYPEQNYSIQSIISAVCPLTEKVYLLSSHARKCAINVFKSIISENKSFSDEYVTRLFITSSNAFIRKKLLQSVDFDKNIIDDINYFVSNISLPHFIWVMEFSNTSNYKNKKVTAEIVIDATSSKLEDTKYIYARLGNVIYFNGQSEKILQAPTTFDQYTHNLGEL